MKKFLPVFFAVVLYFAGCATKKEGVETQEALNHLPGTDIPAYYYAAYVDTAIVKTRLETAGFEVLGTYVSAPECETVLATSAELKKMGNRSLRAFATVVRILIDHEQQRIAYTNPVYFSRAYLQLDFDYEMAQRVSKQLELALGEHTPSPDSMPFGQLAGYHFMVGMPYYGDMLKIAEGNTTSLLSSVESYRDGNASIFRLNLADNRILVGIALSKKTEAFVSRLGAQNAEILPYTILIEGDKAVALDPKYYIPLNYPMLNMTELMGIATVPGAIERDLRAVFH